jgi:hypothetical protein
MVRTKVVRVPSLRVAAIAEPANIALELDSMARMVGLFEAGGAYNASRVLLAVQAPPRNFAMLQLLRADSSGTPYYRVNVVDRTIELVAIIGELLCKRSESLRFFFLVVVYLFILEFFVVVVLLKKPRVFKIL